MKLIINRRVKDSKGNFIELNDGDTWYNDKGRWKYHAPVQDTELDYDVNDGLPEEQKIYAYKQFRVEYDENNPDPNELYEYNGKMIPYLHPLYINADFGYKIGKWYKAGVGEYRTHIHDDSDEPYMNTRGKPEAKLMEKELSPRPGLHAGALPSMGHRGRDDLGYNEDGTFKSFHSQEVFALVELSCHKDYSKEAEAKQTNGKVETGYFDATDEFENGYYRFRTKDTVSKDFAWYIAYAMKIVKVISDEEMVDIVTKYNREHNTNVIPQTRGTPKTGKSKSKNPYDRFMANPKLFNSLIKSSKEHGGNISITDISNYLVLFFFDMRMIHLNTTGDSFYTYHALAQELYEKAEDFYDDLIETAKRLGEQVPRMDEIEMSDWNSYYSESPNVAATKSAIASELEIILEKINNVKEGYDSFVYSKLDSMSEFFDKELYKIKQALKSSRRNDMKIIKSDKSFKEELNGGSGEAIGGTQVGHRERGYEHEYDDNDVRTESSPLKKFNPDEYEKQTGISRNLWHPSSEEEALKFKKDNERAKRNLERMEEEDELKRDNHDRFYAQLRKQGYVTDSLANDWKGSLIKSDFDEKQKKDFDDLRKLAWDVTKRVKDGTMSYQEARGRVMNLLHCDESYADGCLESWLNNEVYNGEMPEELNQSADKCCGKCEDGCCKDWEEYQESMDYPVKDDVKEVVHSSKEPIKSAVDGGWEVKSSEASNALEMFKEYMGEEESLESLARAMGDDELRSNLEYIYRTWDIGDYEEQSSVWDAYEYAKDVLGVTELLNSLEKAMGTDKLAECLAYIFRQYDFREWDKRNGSEEIESALDSESVESENNGTIEHFPEWGINYAMYGEDDNISQEEMNMVDECLESHGVYTITGTVEDSENEFDNNPCFGLPCKTVTVTL